MWRMAPIDLKIPRWYPSVRLLSPAYAAAAAGPQLTGCCVPAVSPHRVEPGEHAVIAQVRGCGFRSLGAGRPAYHQCPARPRRTSGPKATPWGLSGRDSEGLRQAMRSPSVKRSATGRMAGRPKW